MLNQNFFILKSFPDQFLHFYFTNFPQKPTPISLSLTSPFLMVAHPVDLHTSSRKPLVSIRAPPEGGGRPADGVGPSVWLGTMMNPTFERMAGIYLPRRYRNSSSCCSVGWLSGHRFFQSHRPPLPNPRPPFFHLGFSSILPLPAFCGYALFCPISSNKFCYLTENITPTGGCIFPPPDLSSYRYSPSII